MQEIIDKIVTGIQAKENIIKNNTIIDQKNLFSIQFRCEEYLQIATYDIPLKCFNILNNLVKIPSDQAKFKECQAITSFLIDYQEKKSNLSFNNEIEKIFESVFTGYKKAKQQELLSESYLRLITYYTYFPEKRNIIWEKIQKLSDEITSLNALTKYKIFIKLYWILKNIQMEKRAFLFLYLSIMACFDKNELNSLIPPLFDELNFIMEIYDIAKNKINSLEDFDKLHKILHKNSFKRNKNYTSLRKEENKKENNKKRIEKEHNLYVTKRLKGYYHLILQPQWGPIQLHAFSNLVNYALKIKSTKLHISNLLVALETLSSYISVNEQKKLMLSHNRESMYLQEKLNLNLIKLPILVKIHPLTSNIKFAFNRNFINIKNKKGNDNDNIFIYNPWEKKQNINYFWTVNSYQKILIRFYNPLSTELILTKINLIFSGDNKPFTFPSNAILVPQSNTDILYKIKLLSDGATNLLGVKYEIENTVGIQYVDENGNGLFYHFDNYSNDSLCLSTNKKELITLRNIKIYPEIPIIWLKVLNEELNNNNKNALILYKYQKFQFDFLITNSSNYPIEKIDIFIYGFKKEDYKVEIEEISLKGSDFEKSQTFIQTGKNYHYKYDYIHKFPYKKIEFKFFYTFKKEGSEGIKPFLHFITNIKTQQLFSFSNLKTSAMLSDHTLEDIIKNDPKINKGYNYNFCSEKYYTSFSLNSSNDLNIKMDILNQYDTINSDIIIEQNKQKEISLIIDDISKINETLLEWKIVNAKIEGKINLYQVIINELNYKFSNTFSFEINQKLNQENEYISIDYVIHNKTKKIFKNLKMRIYLYQRIQDSILINKKLDQNIFYEGSLDNIIKEFKPNEELIFNLKLYPNYNEYVHTTCVLIDTEYKIIYIPSFSKTCILQN